VVPTFVGRIQTRLVTLGVFGLVWTAIVAPGLSLMSPAGTGLATIYRWTLVTWLITMVIGLVFWEPLFHLILRLRWEKDWPTPFLILQAVPEALVVRQVLGAFVEPPPFGAFAMYFASLWLVMVTMINGPMRVLALRWRFQGGRLR
jgi:hypothetical protein